MSLQAEADANDLFWKAYAMSVLQLITQGSTGIGNNSRVLIASSNHSAIPGGSDVPQEITNWGIFNLADKLLDPSDGVTFNPNAARGGYVQALAFYIDNYKPGPNAPPVDPQVAAQLRDATKVQTAADKAADEAFDDEHARFTRANVDGKLKWETWFPEFAPSYVDALEAQQSAHGQVIMLTNQMEPGSDDLGIIKDNLVFARKADGAPIPGLSMATSMDDLTLGPNMTVIPPTSISTFNSSAYSITGYGELIDGWMLTRNQKAPVFTSTISSSVGRKFDAQSFGFSDSESSSGIDLGIFSVGSSSSSSTDASNFQCGSYVDEITLTLSVNFAQTMTISPGTWDVDVVGFVGKVGGIPPPNPKTSVRPTQALFASGIGLVVTFGTSSATAFDTWYKTNSKSTNGGFYIFGIHCGDDSSSNSSATNVMSKSGWDMVHRTLTITPAATAHNAQLLAVMGEIVTL